MSAALAAISGAPDVVRVLAFAAVDIPRHHRAGDLLLHEHQPRLGMLAAIARTAQSPNVLDIVGAAARDRDDVVAPGRHARRPQVAFAVRVVAAPSLTLQLVLPLGLGVLPTVRFHARGPDVLSVGHRRAPISLALMSKTLRCFIGPLEGRIQRKRTPNRC
jgi:hypothetical protein